MVAEHLIIDNTPEFKILQRESRFWCDRGRKLRAVDNLVEMEYRPVPVLRMENVFRDVELLAEQAPETVSAGRNVVGVLPWALDDEKAAFRWVWL